MALFTITNSNGISVLTAFNASTSTGDACLAPDLSPYNVILYHDGSGSYPIVGDSIFDDGAGTIVTSDTGLNLELQMDNLAYLKITAGLSVTISCK